MNILSLSYLQSNYYFSSEIYPTHAFIIWLKIILSSEIVAPSNDHNQQYCNSYKFKKKFDKYINFLVPHAMLWGVEVVEKNAKQHMVLEFVNLCDDPLD